MTEEPLLSGHKRPLTGTSRLYGGSTVVSPVGNETYVSLCLVSRENRWKKRGIALTPTKFGIAFTATFMNQVGRCFKPRRMPF